MFLVGREKETKSAIRTLENGQNVILKGRYGIGRTALARHVAEVIGKGWAFHFIDFSRTPREMCAALAEDLHIPQRRGTKKKPLRYKAQRFDILHGALKGSKRHVIVFDNVAKLTRAKVSLLRSFAEERRFQSITIVERFTTKEDRAFLRSLLYPSVVIDVGYLSKADTILLVRKLAEKKGLHWDDDHIRTYAQATHGYPLGAVDHMGRGRGDP